MPLDAVVKAALGYACQKLKEKVQQALEPTEAQPSLPAEVLNILRLPQRAEKSVLLSLFNCFVGTPKEVPLAGAIHNVIAQTNPLPLPGVPYPAGHITPQQIHAAHTEARRQLAKRQQERIMKRTQELEDEQDLVIDDAEGVEEDEEELYETYRAAKVQGLPHPDPIVETASLASIIPPTPTYEHHLQGIADRGDLSDAQLETIVYANMRFREKLDGGSTAGFFLGDGAGVGKGRQIAALILEHKLTGGKRCLWVSTSNDLRYDAIRDLSDVGAGNIRVYPENNATSMPKDSLSNHIAQGVLFVTYSLLVTGSKEGAAGRGATEDGGNEDGGPAVVENVSRALTKGSRLDQFVKWLSGDEKPLIILDECHKAKNLLASKGKATLTGKAILKLQLHLPAAQVLYSSATGASEPNNLAYMVRLGSCGFKDMGELVKELNESGLGSLEIFSMGLKATGSYVSRALSYKGAEFQIAKIPIDPIYKVMYNRSTEFFALIYSYLKALPRRPKRLMSLFFSAQQRFYRQMLMAAKVPETAQLALKAVEEGMCVVIGLQSTGESGVNQVREILGDSLDDFVSAPRQILNGFLENHFPTDACGMTETDINSLHTKVFMAVQYWKDMLPATEQVQQDQAQASQGGAGGKGASSSRPGSSAAAAAAESSDDELAPIETLTLDQAIERQTEEAKRSGRFVDLTELDEADEEVQRAKIAMRQEIVDDAEEEKREANAKVQRVKDEQQMRIDEAEEQVKDAEQLLARVRQQLKDCDAQLGGQTGQASGSKRLRKSLEPSKAADSWDLDSDVDSEDDSDDEVVASRPQKRNRGGLAFSESDDETGASKKAKRAGKVQSKPAKQASTSVVDLVSSESEEEETSPLKVRKAVANKGAIIESSDSEEAEDGSEEEESSGVSNVVCVVCQKSDRDDQLLLCDACDVGAHHLDCLDPPLKELPDGDWFCPKCAAGGNSSLSLPACKVCGSQDGQGALVTCCECKDGPSHIHCLSPALEAVPRPFTCGTCKTAAVGRAARGFVSSGRPNRGALVMKEKAAIRGLEAARKELRAVRGTSDREERAARRSSGGPITNGLSLSLPSEESEDADSDYDVLEHASSPPKKKGSAKEVKPKVRQSMGYQHTTKRVELGENWQAEVEAAGEQAPQDHPRLVRVRTMLLKVLHSLELPANPLDQLTELMGGPTAVAEMTGRKGQLVQDEDNGGVKYQQRSQEDAMRNVNIREKARFMNGEKLIAIISEAASTGISLQADRRVKNQRRRCHLTLELPWSADKAIQQFGRSHRSNQTSAPIYRIIVTECAGEYRFAASAAKRLQSLGALLKGDRRALGAGQDLKEFDCDNKWGATALKRIFSDLGGDTTAMPGIEVPRVPAEGRIPGRNNDTPSAFYEYLKPKLAEVGMMSQYRDRYGGTSWREEEKVTKKVSTWLNRVLALAVDDQALLFKYFSNTYDASVLAAKSRGEYDQGITSLRASAVKIADKRAIHTDPSGASTFHSILDVDRGLPWEDALEFRDAFNQEQRDEGRKPSTKSGFYADNKKHGSDAMPYVILATEHKKLWRNGRRQFRVQRPNISTCPKFMEEELERGYHRINDDRARQVWRYWFELTNRMCIHGKECARRKRGENCDFGMRVQKMHLISGAVLPILKPLYHVVHTSAFGRSATKKKAAPRVMRVKLSKGEVLVGMQLLPQDAQLLEDKLQEGDFENPAGGSNGGMSLGLY